MRFKRNGVEGASSSSRMPCPQTWFSPIERLVRDPHFSSFGLHQQVLDQPFDDYNRRIYCNIYIHNYKNVVNIDVYLLRFSSVNYCICISTV